MENKNGFLLFTCHYHSLSTGFKLEERCTFWLGKILISCTKRHMKTLFGEHLGVWGGPGVGLRLWTQHTYHPSGWQVCPAHMSLGAQLSPGISYEDPRRGTLKGHVHTEGARLTAPQGECGQFISCSSDALVRWTQPFNPNSAGSPMLPRDSGSTPRALSAGLCGQSVPMSPQEDIPQLEPIEAKDLCQEKIAKVQRPF